MDTSDELELISAWRGGDLRAGERLLARHLETVRRFFCNKVSGSAEDLVQKTLLACAESIGKFEGRASFRSYLLAIARNVLFRHYRDRDAGFDPLTSSVSGMEVQQGSPADYVASCEEQRLLLRALRTLPADTQALLELAYWESMSDRELSEVVGIPVGTVKSRLRKARQQIDRAFTTMNDKAPSVETSLSSLESWAERLRGKNPIDYGQGRR